MTNAEAQRRGDAEEIEDFLVEEVSLTSTSFNYQPISNSL